MTPQGRQWPHSAVFNANFEQISCLALVFEQENVGWIYHNKSCIFFLTTLFMQWVKMVVRSSAFTAMGCCFRSENTFKYSMFIFFLNVTLPLDQEFFNHCDTISLKICRWNGIFLLSFTGKLKWMINYFMINYLFCLFVLSHDLKANWEIFRLPSFRAKSIVVLKMYNSWIEKNNENEIIHEKYMKSFSVSIISKNDK